MIIVKIVIKTGRPLKREHECFSVVLTTDLLDKKKLIKVSTKRNGLKDTLSLSSSFPTKLDQENQCQ